MQIAAAYIRVSTDDQTEYSPDAQLRALRAWASSHGYIIPDEYVFSDEGISGRKAEKRPGFMRMIGTAKLKPRPFDAILVHKFDRFARSREDSVVYKSMLRRNCGVQVISVTESIEDDKFSVILEAMLEAMAEYYSINLAEEVRKGMTEKARRGERQTSAPFGYRMRDGMLRPEPSESAIVRTLFQRFADGESYFQLARWLNDSGVRTRTGNTFQNRSVRYILTNHTYIGKNCWTPENARDTSTGYVVTDKTIIVDASHDPIVDICTWNAVQKRVADLKRQFGHDKRPSTHADWVSGLVRCPYCGSVMIRNVQGKYADGRPKIYWLCNNYAHGRCSHTNSCTDAEIKSAVIDSLRAITADSDSLVSVIENAIRHPDTADPYAAMYARLDQQLQRAQEAYRAGIDTLDEYASAKLQIFDARAKLDAERASSAVRRSYDANSISARILNSIAAVTDLLASDAPASQKHDAAHALIDRVVFNHVENTVYAVIRSDNFIKASNS